MARGSGSRTRSSGGTTTTPSSLGLLLRPIRPLPMVQEPVIQPMTEVQDFRLHHPAPAWSQPAKTKKGTRSTIGPNMLSPNLTGVRFHNPKQVLVCVRRKQRREVLFAKMKTGKGARARRHKRNKWSEIQC